MARSRPWRPATAPADHLFIPAGARTVTIALPAGRTETRDVACSADRDRFETTVEYSDILDDDQSISFSFRETDNGTDVNFVFQAPELGGLAVRPPEAISGATLDGSSFGATLDPCRSPPPDPPVRSVSRGARHDSGAARITGTAARPSAT